MSSENEVQDGLAQLFDALFKPGQSLKKWAHADQCWKELLEAMRAADYDAETLCMYYHGFHAIMLISDGVLSEMSHLALSHGRLSAAKAALSLLEFDMEAHAALDTVGKKVGVDAVRCFSIAKSDDTLKLLRETVAELEAKQRFAEEVLSEAGVQA